MFALRFLILIIVWNGVFSENQEEQKIASAPKTVTIPLKNAVVQELTPVNDRHEVEGAGSSPARDGAGGDDMPPGVLGEIVYEDEIPGELSDWMPPPPPPPEHLFMRRPGSLSSSMSYQKLSSIVRPSSGTSARLFGDDFALFLVILTIAGFFGLMLAMFMPFTFLMQQQPLGGFAGGYPGAAAGLGYPAAGISSAAYGYPYGRRRKKRENLPLTRSELLLMNDSSSLQRRREDSLYLSVIQKDSINFLLKLNQVLENYGNFNETDFSSEMSSWRSKGGGRDTSSSSPSSPSSSSLSWGIP